MHVYIFTHYHELNERSFVFKSTNQIGTFKPSQVILGVEDKQTEKRLINLFEIDYDHKNDWTSIEYQGEDKNIKIIAQ